MNVFVLCTGRCGSHTFAAACQHISNYTAGHETRCQMIGADRLAYPENHIEADARLAWFLGRLDETYGTDAFYVHLIRDPEGTAHSFTQRFSWQGSIAAAYRNGILKMTPADRLDCCRDYVETVSANIRHFLRDKPHMRFSLEAAPDDWRDFWSRIGAEGDFDASLSEWATPQHTSRATITLRSRMTEGVRAAFRLR